MPNVMETAAMYPELSLSVSLFERAGLTGIFQCPGPFTALFPSNAAWDSLNPTFLEYFLRPENSEFLEDILLYHILPGTYNANDLEPGEVETLLTGEYVTVSVDPILFNDAGVARFDISACNGLIDILSSVLLPFPERTFT